MMGNISIHDLARVADYLDQTNDPRRTAYGNIRHKLTDIIVIAFTAALCGYEDYEEMEEFGRLKQDFLKSFLELPNGIPDESAFRRVLQCLNPRGLQEGLENWLVDVKVRQKGEEEGARLVNIDGKTIRGSGFHVVSAWIGEHGLTLGQLTTEEKSNEIKAVPKLLDMLEVKGDVVTADAMSCQKDIARKIREKGADYILAVKENQPTLHEDIKDYFEGMESGEIKELPEDLWQGAAEKGHGRVERREIRTATGLEWLEGREAWEGLRAIVQYRTFRKVKGKETIQTDQYYLSSGDFSAEEFLKYIRGHWSIENQLHWMLDIVFREDECRVRTGNAALNLNILRKMALHRLKKMKMEKKRVSAKRRMMHAALDSDFLYEALFSE
jgi:predicted transposase YbfD/YdcC